MLQPIALKNNTTRLKALLDNSKTTLYLVASLSVFSCQENSLVNPELTQSQSLTVALDQAMGAPKKYKLTKWGNQKLIYYSDGRIKGFLDASYGLTATYSYNYTPGTLYSSGSIDVVLYAPSTIRRILRKPTGSMIRVTATNINKSTINLLVTEPSPIS